MRKLILILLVLAAFVPNIAAADLQDELQRRFDTEQLEDSLPADAKRLLEGVTPADADGLLPSISKILEKGIQKNGGAVKEATALMFRILVIVVLCQLAESICGEHGQAVACMTGALALTVCCTADLRTLIGLGRTTMDSLSNFSNVLLPVIATAAATAGSTTGAGTTYSISVFFFNILIQAGNSLVVPSVYAYTALALADGVLQQERLKRIRVLLGWVIELGMKGIVYAFVGLLGITGAISGNTDTAALKAAKSALSTMLPVVGGIVSGAAETLLHSASLLKASVGTFGMLGIFSIFLLPFLRMGCFYLILKLTAALCGIIGSKLCSLLEALSSAMGYIMGMVGSCALIVLLSCCSFLRSVQVS